MITIKMGFGLAHTPWESQCTKTLTLQKMNTLNMDDLLHCELSNAIASIVSLNDIDLSLFTDPVQDASNGDGDELSECNTPVPAPESTPVNILENGDQECITTVIAPESTPINPTIKPPINILENGYQECITTVLAPESKVRSKSYTRF